VFAHLESLLLLLLNHLPPDITSGQGLNGFQKIIFILQYFLHYTRYGDDIFDKKTKMAAIFFQKIRNVLAIQITREYYRKDSKRDSL